MLPPCPYVSGKHTLNPFKHKTFSVGLTGKGTRQFLAFGLTDTLGLFPAMSCTFQIGLVCPVLVWTIRRNWLCALRQTNRTDDLEMSAVKKKLFRIICLRFLKIAKHCITHLNVVKERGGLLLTCIRLLFWALSCCLYRGVPLHYLPIKRLKKGCTLQGFLNTAFRLTEQANRTLKEQRDAQKAFSLQKGCINVTNTAYVNARCWL